MDEVTVGRPADVDEPSGRLRAAAAVMGVLLVAVTGVFVANVALGAPTVVDLFLAGVLVLLVLLAAALARARASVRRSLETLRSRERHLLALTGAISDVVFVRDATGQVTFVSPSIHRALGVTPEEFLARPIRERVLPDQRDRFVAESARLRREPGLVVFNEFRMELAPGDWRWLEVRGVNLLEEPDVNGVVSSVRDVTDRRAVLDALAHSETRFRSLADAAPVGVFHLSDEGRIDYVNAQTVEILGLSEELLISMSPADIVGGSWAPDQPELVGRMAAVYRSLMEDPGGDAAIEVAYDHPSGLERWLAFRGRQLYDSTGRPDGVIGTMEDVTASRMAASRLRHQAMHDALTGLPNRRMLLEELGAAMDRADAEGRLVAVLFCDIDLFKVVNDSLGHDVGDQLLPAIAQRFARVLRPGDILARFGGDEFVVVCDGVSAVDEAELLAHHLVDSLRDPISVSEHLIRVATSVGVAVRRMDHDRPDALVRDADLAMYRAKESGRNRVAVFDDGLRQRALRRMSLEQSLRGALDRDELALVFQPQVSLTDGSILAVEALLRWASPEHGAVAAADFVPVAEEIGLVIELDEWVLRTACRQLADWRSEIPGLADLRVSVNLSGRHLGRMDLPGMVASTLSEAGLAPERLELEITETAVMADAATSVNVLGDLKAIGVRLAVDDFGTGYSSLAYLRRFPVDVLKIDQEFVANLGSDDGAARIVGAIVALARVMELSTVAEGVESMRQVVALQAAGCEFAQGFLFARPLPPDQIARLLAEPPGPAWLSGKPGRRSAARPPAGPGA